MPLLGKIAMKAVRGYQIFISPVLSDLGVRCRFYPTCSQYAILALQKNGFLKGTKQIFQRLRRCNKYNLDSCIDYPE
jgi:putative membrane protein insertion efficiency factor